jgi:hypothetical protein
MIRPRRRIGEVAAVGREDFAVVILRVLRTVYSRALSRGRSMLPPLRSETT